MNVKEFRETLAEAMGLSKNTSMTFVCANALRKINQGRTAQAELEDVRQKVNAMTGSHFYSEVKPLDQRLDELARTVQEVQVLRSEVDRQNRALEGSRGKVAQLQGRLDAISLLSDEGHL